MSCNQALKLELSILLVLVMKCRFLLTHHFPHSTTGESAPATVGESNALFCCTSMDQGQHFKQRSVTNRGTLEYGSGGGVILMLNEFVHGESALKVLSHF